MREVYWGLGTGGVLLALLGWVRWKGAHPDPSLFDMSAALAEGAAPSGVVDAVDRRAGGRLGAPRSAQGEEGESAGAARGPLPAGLAAGGFREGKVGSYTADNLYVKINGRAGFFQSFGVRTLHTLSLEGPEAEGAPTSVDIELYDLGESRNAIGAYNAERPPEMAATAGEGSTFHTDRNAAFLARGRHYARLIGSDESPPVVAEVRRLLDVFRRALPGEALPWGFALFTDQLKIDAARVTYVKSNAFSFGFARDVFKAQLSPAESKDDVEAFVVASADEPAARALAAQFAEGFASLGAPAGETPAQVPLYEDEFLATFSGATAVERWVVGVRGVPTRERAAELLEQLDKGVRALPEEVRARAVPSPDLEEMGAGDYGGVSGGPVEASEPEPAGASEPTPANAGEAAEQESDEY